MGYINYRDPLSIGLKQLDAMSPQDRGKLMQEVFRENGRPVPDPAVLERMNRQQVLSLIQEVFGTETK